MYELSILIFYSDKISINKLHPTFSHLTINIPL